MMELFVAFLIKHFVCDFPLQAFPYMYRNKGEYGHFGGVLHALVHYVGTIIVVSLFTDSWGIITACAAIDFVTHYHIDWAKMNIGKHYNLKPDNSEWFWILLGVDQLLHYLTYSSIMYYLTTEHVI